MRSEVFKCFRSIHIQNNFFGQIHKQLKNDFSNCKYFHRSVDRAIFRSQKYISIHGHVSHKSLDATLNISTNLPSKIWISTAVSVKLCKHIFALQMWENWIQSEIRKGFLYEITKRTNTHWEIKRIA